ncbi:MAG: hypothetical protein ABFC56_03255 [Clostridiaceae bacterium]
MIDISFGSDQTPSATINLVGLLWFALKFIFITYEFTYSRAKIIESLLNSEFMADKESLISDSIHPNSFWMEYKTKKVKLLQVACLNYLDCSENRKTLSAFSDLCYSECLNRIKTAKSEIKDLFGAVILELQKEIIKLAILDYPEALKNEEYASKMLEIFGENSRTGNLTD